MHIEEAKRSAFLQRTVEWMGASEENILNGTGGVNLTFVLQRTVQVLQQKGLTTKLCLFNTHFKSL